jgi:hypothetical protein
MDGLGMGLASMAFWGFIAVAVVAGIWDGIRKREARHETLRKMIDSGNSIDKADLDRFFGESENTSRDLKIGGVITLFCAPGLVALGWFAGMDDGDSIKPMLGVAALVASVGIGLLVAAKVADRGGDDD